jgi:hypothetical protein
MSAKTIISPPGVACLTRSTTAHSPNASLCLLLSDFIGLSAVLWLVVWSKYVFNPDLELRFYLEVFPSVLIFLGCVLFANCGST